MMRGSLSALSAAALALMLAACTTTSPPPPTQAALPPAPAAPMPKPPPRKPLPPNPALAPAPSTVEPEAPAPADALATPPALAAIEPPAAIPAPPAPRLDRLIGLNQPEVAQMLGEPRSRAESPPATIWRYDGSTCALDVYFYLDLQSQAMRALHYEVRSHDAAERSAQRCYETLLSERRANAEPAAGSDRPR